MEIRGIKNRRNCWLLVLFMVSAPLLTAQTLRGRLVRQFPSSKQQQELQFLPAVSVKVSLIRPEQVFAPQLQSFVQNSPQFNPLAVVERAATVYSDSRGMYYFKNVPPGEYILEIWLSKAPFEQNYSQLDLQEQENHYLLYDEGSLLALYYLVQAGKESYTDIRQIVLP